jgi:hypothetical protein
MSVIDEVVAERRRQVEEEGYTPEYDDQHHDCQLACAAACYALASDDMSNTYDLATIVWPAAWIYGKPTTPRRNLIKAAALIVAEIERIDRNKEQHNG